MNPEINFNYKQFNSFINQLIKFSSLKDPILDVYSDKVEARERTDKKTSLFVKPLKQLEVKTDNIDEVLQHNIFKISGNESEKKEISKSLSKSIDAINKLLTNPKLEEESFNKLDEIKHSLQIVNNFLNPQKEIQAQRSRAATMQSDAPKEFDVLKGIDTLLPGYLMGTTKEEDAKNREVIKTLLENDKMRSVFVQLLKEVDIRKSQNTKLFESGEVFPLVHEPLPIMMNIPSPIEHAIALATSLGMDEMKIAEIIRNVMFDLFQSTGSLANTQIHSDSIKTALPKSILEALDKSFSGPQSRAIGRMEEYEQKYQAELEQLKGENPKNFDERKGELDFTRGYESEGSSFLYGRSTWIDIDKTDKQPFISGTRLIGYMNPTKTKKKEIEVELDLKPLGDMNSEQCVDIFEFLTEFSLGMNSYAQFIEEHQGKKEPLKEKDIPVRVKGELDKLKFLSQDQKMQLVQIATDFEYNVFYNLSKARYELLR